jgi:hypothetical protein
MPRKSLVAWEKVVRDGEQARRVLHMREVMRTAALSRAWIGVDARRSTVHVMSCVRAGVERVGVAEGGERGAGGRRSRRTSGPRLLGS